MASRDTLKVGGQSLKVVGVLKPDLALFANSYLVPADAANDRLFPAAVPTVLHAWLVRVPAGKLPDAEVRKPIEQAFPPSKYAWVAAEDRLDSRTYYRYLTGLAIFLLGGSGALIGLFRWLAGKFVAPALAKPLLEMKDQKVEDPGIRIERAPILAGPLLEEMKDQKVEDPGIRIERAPILAGPLLEMRARPRLVWGVHVVYFGLVIAGSLLVSEVPEMQVVLLGKVREALATKSNPLGIAAEAYLSGNILRAAAVTFVVNFLLGSLASITLPSFVLPGIGALLAAVRALVWGLILAPTMDTLAVGMLPHSLTMLLEGEGYILAALFGLLIPIHVVSRRLGGNLFTRFGRALLLNLKAQFWIALVLAVAAIYEATELILLNR